MKMEHDLSKEDIHELLKLFGNPTGRHKHLDNSRLSELKNEIYLKLKEEYENSLSSIGNSIKPPLY